MIRFKDRKEAGQQLAKQLERYKNRPDVVVIGLPRGGVVNAFEVAQALKVPLDVIVPRKIGAPLQPELAVGAVTEDGALLFNEDVLEMIRVKKEDVKHIIEAEKKEAQRRIAMFRKDKPPLDLHGKTAILIDDGVATGATMRAAIRSAQKKGAEHIVLALPVAPQRFRDTIAKEVDEIVILDEPDFFPAVGYFYQDFTQTEDEEVIELLEKMDKLLNEGN